MSSLHPDRLPTEGAGPVPGTRSTLTTARSAQRRGTLTGGQAADPPAGRGRTARRVAATVARTATSAAARTATATAQAAATGARAAATKATAAKASATKAATVKPTTAKPATAEAGAKASTTKAATAEAGAKPTTAKTATAKASAKASTTKAATAKASTAEAPTAGPAAAATATAATTPSARRPSPVPTAVLQDLPAGGGPAVEELRLPGDTAPAILRLLGRRGGSTGRRRSFHLAAALATVIGIGGGFSSLGPAALAGTGTTTASAPVSVADQLGIEAKASPIVDAETTDRLGELVASRAERDAEQTQAARVQAEADRAAAEAERRAAAAAAEAARPDAVLPVEGARLTSGFGARWGTLHAGIDLAAPMHTPEYAAMDGIVLEAGPASGYGLAVYLQHENGDVTVYGHMDEILVTPGQVVQAGDTIALLGNTGQSTGPHLHFEVHQGGLDGTKIDPLPWLRERGVEI